MNELSTKELVALARALLAAGAFDDFGEFANGRPDLVVDFFESPWTYSRELSVWDSLGRPSEGDPTFETFAEVLARGDAGVRMWLAEREAAPA